MSILVVTVGYSKTIHEAILFSIDKHAPQKVLFLCTETSKEKTLPILKTEMDNSRRHISYNDEVLEKEDDVQYLYSKCLIHLNKQLEHISPQDLIIDYTSGTKAMSAALFAAAIAVEAGKVSYVTGQKNDNLQVIKSDKLEVLYPADIYAERQIHRAWLLFNKLDFVASKELTDSLRNTLPEGSLKQQAKTLWILSGAYDSWERFQWKEAIRLLKKAVNPRENLSGVDTDLLNRQIAFIQGVIDDEWGSHRLVELFLNAKRRLVQGHLDDALSRMYRAYEYLSQVRLMKKHGFDASNIEILILTGKVFPETVKRYENNHNYNKDTIRLGLRDSIELLAGLKDTVGEKLFELYWRCSFDLQNPPKNQSGGPLKGWLESRNRSFLAHGSTPIGERMIVMLIEEYEKLLPDIIDKTELGEMIRNGSFVCDLAKK